jgi:hypothetical protein
MTTPPGVPVTPAFKNTVPLVRMPSPAVSNIYRAAVRQRAAHTTTTCRYADSAAKSGRSAAYTTDATNDREVSASAGTRSGSTVTRVDRDLTAVGSLVGRGICRADNHIAWRPTQRWGPGRNDDIATTRRPSSCRAAVNVDVRPVTTRGSASTTGDIDYTAGART